MAVTGWAVDDLEVAAVHIYRDPVAGEGSGLIYIGEAVQVQGARPDVAALYPTYAFKDRAGWGYLLLTNFLPAQGNGTFTLRVFAEDREGKQSLLGTRTVSVATASATTPFGAIDTPGQGETVNGIVSNFGWVLSPGSRHADGDHGGTVSVLIDGEVVGAPAGWTSRADLSQLFPLVQFAGVNSALAVFGLDTTTLADGVHTIAWVVTDDQGETAGVGSRYFTVANGSALPASARGDVAGVSSAIAAAAADSAQPAAAHVEARTGADLQASLQEIAVDDAGVVTIHAEELAPIMARVAGATGVSQVAGGQLIALPIGAQFAADTGTLSWLPGVAFVGRYEFMFVGDGVQQFVRIVLHPERTFSTPHVVIDEPGAQKDLSGWFTIGGWALDPRAPSGSGIDAVHAWAYPKGGGTPIFLGAATLGERPDVAAFYGDRFRHSGFGLQVSGIPAGDYIVAVFPHSTASNVFLSAATVAVRVW
ncbi:MAG: hypothetical protein ABI632_09760 [Pseudolysinimonas sp.]